MVGERILLTYNLVNGIRNRGVKILILYKFNHNILGELVAITMGWSGMRFIA